MSVLLVKIDLEDHNRRLYPDDPDQFLVMRSIADDPDNIEVSIGDATVKVSILEMLSAVDILNRAAGGDC
jgi:hypothetical protein